MTLSQMAAAAQEAQQQRGLTPQSTRLPKQGWVQGSSARCSTATILTDTLCFALTQRVEDAAWVAIVAAAFEQTLQPCKAARLALALGLAVVHPPLSLYPPEEEELHHQQGACTGDR